MSSSSNTIIAKKAYTTAEADFATWLMMAKLGGFDDLPSNAQGSLINSRTRLETMYEFKATAPSVHVDYSAYNRQLGYVGGVQDTKVLSRTTQGTVELF